MTLDFSQRDEIKFAHIYPAGAINLEDEAAEVSGEVEITGAARRNAKLAQVKGHLRGQIQIACSRCLQLVAVEFDTSFEADFVTLANYEKSSAEREITSADFSLSVYDGERINLDEIVREQILLDLPAHQLCQENCAGLCEKCGANKNTNACACEAEDVDPRWSALRELKRNT